MMNNMLNMAQMIQQLKTDPVKMLSKRFNLPENAPTNPQDLLQYLLDSGQVSQQQINNAMQMRKMFMK